jgi:acyl-CoA reductase-like NAD-dependent aldehyde dehydrogenase
MVKVTPVEDAKESFKEILPKIPDRYTRKIKKAKWKEAATSDAAEALWKAKVMEAAEKRRRKARLEKVSEDEWRSLAVSLGSKRIKESLEGRIDKWAHQWRPYAEALSTLELEPRSADPEENIDNRVKPVVMTLIKKKKEILGETG